MCVDKFTVTYYKSKFKSNDKQTSSNVSGNGIPLVSGSNNSAKIVANNVIREAPK